MLELLGDNSWIAGKVLVATWETIYMVLISTFLSYVFGLPLGIILVTTAKNHIMENKGLNRVLGSVVNAARSIPFIIFLILLIPLTRFLIGTSIGTVASIVPLTLAAIPFVARLVETSLKEIEQGLIEAAISMGANARQVIAKVLLPEAMPSLLLGVAITAINLVGYSAMAGTVGGGGVGDLAIRYGYQRYQTDVMLICVAILVVLVQILQFGGDYAAKKLNRK